MQTWTGAERRATRPPAGALVFPAFLLVLFLTAGFPAWGARILYLAPHPDDEVIPLGGWLYERIAAGDAVSVAVVTDGEAFTKALRAQTPRPAFLFRASDYRRLGRIRRREAGRAMDLLGIPLGRRYFLGYPSGALMALWRCRQGRQDVLMTSRATGQRFGIAEWQGRRRPPHPFSRGSFLRDLRRLLQQTTPDILVVSHPLDSNPDHRALAFFVREVMGELQPPPRVMGYLVHRGSRRVFPEPFGFHPELGLQDPKGMPLPQRHFPLPAARQAKLAALRAHGSQIRLKDGFLLSFVRTCELWWPLGPHDWPMLTGFPRSRGSARRSWFFRRRRD